MADPRARPRERPRESAHDGQGLPRKLPRNVPQRCPRKCPRKCRGSPVLFSPVRNTESKQKGGFVKGWFWRMCPRSGFWYRRPGFCTLVPVCGVRPSGFYTLSLFRLWGSREHPPKLLETTLLRMGLESTKINSFVPGRGDLPREGVVVRRVRSLPGKFVLLGFRRDVPGILPGCPGPLRVLKSKFVNQGKKKHININKFAGLSRDWVGAENLFLCFFFGSFLMGEKKHINKIPPKIPGQSREIFVYVFFSLCVFFAP